MSVLANLQHIASPICSEAMSPKGLQLKIAAQAEDKFFWVFLEV